MAVSKQAITIERSAPRRGYAGGHPLRNVSVYCVSQRPSNPVSDILETTKI